MDEERKSTIEMWTPAAEFPRKATSRCRFSSAVLGTIGTVILHALLLPGVLWGSGAHADHAQVVPDLASLAFSSDAAADITLLPPQKSNAASSDLLAALSAQSIDLATSLRKNEIAPAPALPVLDIPDVESHEHPSDAVQGVDAGEYAQLYGIYSGQIQARIDRLWRRPRSPIAGNPAREPDEFHCLVNIIQDAGGNVQEVLLPHCNGSAEWQRSLVLAIQQASPLPAPPKPTVFTRSIALSFSALAYSSAAAADEYEIAAH